MKKMSPSWIALDYLDYSEKRNEAGEGSDAQVLWGVAEGTGAV